MNGISNYRNYQNSYITRSMKKEEKGRTEDASKNLQTKRQEAVGKANSAPKLSERAKTLLKELKEKYTNMDFMVAEYETEEEAQSYLSRGMKEYSVLIDPQTLEKMAADEEVKQKYLGMLEDATDKMGQIREQLEEQKEEGVQIKSLGIVLDEDGTIRYFAELEKTSAKQKERIEEEKDRRMDSHEAAGYLKRKYVRADSAEELIKQINEIDWTKLHFETKEKQSKIDYMA